MTLHLTRLEIISMGSHCRSTAIAWHCSKLRNNIYHGLLTQNKLPKVVVNLFPHLTNDYNCSTGNNVYYSSCKLSIYITTHTSSQAIKSRFYQRPLYLLTNQIAHQDFWIFLLHRLSKRQSSTIVLLRTPVTHMIFFNQGRLLLGSNHFLIFFNVIRSHVETEINMTGGFVKQPPRLRSFHN